MLLAQNEGSDSGSDCNAYYVERVYGTNRTLQEVARYYEDQLGAEGWTHLPDYISNGPSAAEFRRGQDEYLWVLTSEYVGFVSRVRTVPPERLAQFRTLYILHIGRSCGLGPTELQALDRSE